MKIYTARYHNSELASGKYIPIGISQGKAKWLTYQPIYIEALAPSWQMVKMTDKDAYKELYFKQLDKLGIETIRKLIHNATLIAENSQHGYTIHGTAAQPQLTGLHQEPQATTQNNKPIVLLCYEDLRKPELWCHRTMFAEWFEIQTNIKIEEIPEEQAKPTQTKRLPTLLELL